MMKRWIFKRECTHGFWLDKKGGELRAKVQTPARTNALLKRAGVDKFAADEFLPSELGKILGVDCVVMGSFEPLNQCQLLRV